MLPTSLVEPRRARYSVFQASLPPYTRSQSDHGISPGFNRISLGFTRISPGFEAGVSLFQFLAGKVLRLTYFLRGHPRVNAGQRVYGLHEGQRPDIG